MNIERQRRTNQAEIVDFAQNSCKKNRKFVETSGAKTLNDGMLQHSFEGAMIFVSLQHFIAPAFELMPCLPSRQRREAIGTFNPRREHSITAFSYLPTKFRQITRPHFATQKKLGIQLINITFIDFGRFINARMNTN